MGFMKKLVIHNKKEFILRKKNQRKESPFLEKRTSEIKIHILIECIFRKKSRKCEHVFE